MDAHKGGNGGNIQAMGTSHSFFIRQVVLLGVSDHCVKKILSLVSMNVYILKYYGLDSISLTGSVKVMVYKSLLSATYTVTSLIVCR